MEIITNRNNIKVIIGGKTPRERRAYHLHVVGITNSGGMYALIPLSIQVAIMVLQSLWILGNNIDIIVDPTCVNLAGFSRRVAQGMTFLEETPLQASSAAWMISLAITLAQFFWRPPLMMMMMIVLGGCYKLLYKLFISLLFGTG